MTLTRTTYSPPIEAGSPARPLVLARIFLPTGSCPLYFVARHLNFDHVREQDR
jgi:hypothetical protein